VVATRSERPLANRATQLAGLRLVSLCTPSFRGGLTLQRAAGCFGSAPQPAGCLLANRGTFSLTGRP
jgi:hypothetical protein